MKIQTILTTVGTSILTNFSNLSTKDAKPKDFIPVSEHINDLIENKITLKKEFIKENIKKYFIGYKRARKKQNWIWENNDNKPNFDICAEITTIYEIIEKLKLSSNPLHLKIILIYTDTFESELSAELIKDFFDEIQVKCNLFVIEIIIKKIENLNLEEDNESFKKFGINNLILKIEDFFANAGGYTKDRKEALMMNISGGYKILIPYMTILGQILDIDIYYIHEEKKKLMSISSLPIDFDMNKAQLYFEHLKFTGDLTQEKDIDQESKTIIDNLEKQLLVIKMDNKFKVTALGKIMYNYFIFKESDVGKTVFGSNLELYLYKFFKENNLNFEHSKKFEYNRNNAECDFIFKDASSAIDKCLEVKAWYNFMTDESIIKQYEKDINNFKVKKFHIIVYKHFYDKKFIENKASSITLLDLNNNKIFIARIIEIYNRVKEKPTEFIVSVLGIHLPLDSSENPYLQFAQKGIEAKNFIVNYKIKLKGQELEVEETDNVFK